MDALWVIRGCSSLYSQVKKTRCTLAVRPVHTVAGLWTPNRRGDSPQYWHLSATCQVVHIPQPLLLQLLELSDDLWVVVRWRRTV